jgi:ABC-type nickel/cobalt efflux system permease component RcnA
MPPPLADNQAHTHPQAQCDHNHAPQHKSNDNKSGIAVVYVIGLEVCFKVILVVVVDILFNYCLKIIFSIHFFR